MVFIQVSVNYLTLIFTTLNFDYQLTSPRCHGYSLISLRLSFQAFRSGGSKTHFVVIVFFISEKTLNDFISVGKPVSGHKNVLHGASSTSLVALPGHGSPSGKGLGLLQSRILVKTPPPQVLLHEVQLAQAPQPPSMSMRGKQFYSCTRPFLNGIPKSYLL